MKIFNGRFVAPIPDISICLSLSIFLAAIASRGGPSTTLSQAQKNSIYVQTNTVETNYVSNCVVSSTYTNDSFPGAMYPETPDATPVAVCVGEPVSVYGGPAYYDCAVRQVVTTYTGGGGCTPTTNYVYSAPSIVSQSYTITGPASGSGTGDSATVNPTSAGSGTVTFTLTYDDGLGNTQTVQSATYYAATNCTGVTNCTVANTSSNCSPGSMSYGSAYISPSGTNCVGTSIYASLGSAIVTPGFVTTTTTYTDPSNCPAMSNSFPVYPSVVSVTYIVSGPYSGSGSGSSVSFTPTNAGSGTVTFTVTYADGCGGTGTATSSGTYQVNACATNCVETSRTTNCLTEATVTLTPVTNSVSGCQSNQMSVSVTRSNTQGQIEIVINYSNCPPTRTTNTYSPSFGSNWWVVTGVGAVPSSGSGLTATFTPTNGGNGTVTFYQNYTNPPPCTGHGPASTSVSINVAAMTKTTNCLKEGSIQLTNVNGTLKVCVSNQITATVYKSNTLGQIKITTSYTPSNCPTVIVTNTYTPGVMTNWWQAVGPGSFSNSGSGLTATFTPTNAGRGTLTFYLIYTNPAPCTGSNLVTYATNYSAYAISNWTVSAYPANDQRRLRVGVGEEVDLYIIPADPVTWTTTSGGVNPSSGSSTRFTAPTNATQTTSTIRADYGSGNCPITFNVYPPTGINHARVIETNSYPKNDAGAGMHLYVWMAPTNVSFYRVQCLEVGSNAINVTGYYTNYAVSNISHIGHGADEWFQLEPDNMWPSTWDNATSGSGGFLPQPWYAGGYTWPIPGRWKIGTSATNNLTGWQQSTTIDANGTVTVSKFGFTVTRTTNDVITVTP